MSAGANSSAVEGLVVFNDGFFQDLVISEIGLEGDQAASFEVVTPSPLTIPVEGSATIEIHYNAGATVGGQSLAQLFLQRAQAGAQAASEEEGRERVAVVNPFSGVQAVAGPPCCPRACTASGACRKALRRGGGRDPPPPVSGGRRPCAQCRKHSSRPQR